VLRIRVGPWLEIATFVYTNSLTRHKHYLALAFFNAFYQAFEQIIAILKEREAGRPTAEVCRKHGISDATFYKWKAKYGGLEVSEAKRLKALEDETGS
jgi:hypothetical protein